MALLGVLSCVSTLWLRFRKQKICVVHRSQSNQAITKAMRQSFQQIQSGEVTAAARTLLPQAFLILRRADLRLLPQDKMPEGSPYTLRFRYALAAPA